MIKQFVQFGTTHKVRIESVSPSLIVCVGTENNEGYVLTGHDNTILPNPGDEGTVVFTAGGPMKGYWKYVPGEKEKPFDHKEYEENAAEEEYSEKGITKK